MDTTLKALLQYMKQERVDTTWQAVRDNALGAIYHRDMSLGDVVKVLLTAYTKALMEPKFELPGRHNASEDLLLAPIKGHHAVDFMGPSSVEVRYSVEQFYGAMIDKMLGDLQVARVDWCRDELWSQSAIAIAGFATPALS